MGYFQPPVSEFGRAVTTNSQHAIQAARLEIKNPQMSFFKGSNDLVDQDPTGRQYLNHAYPAHYQPVRPPAVNDSQNQFDTSNMPNLGVLYLASQDGKNMVKVFTEPKNMEILRNIINREINSYANTGAAGMA